MSEDAPDLDQQDNLVIPLIDMRPKSRTESTPKRMPTFYVYENGIPKDWDNKQAIKALNDRRQQAIDRITRDPPWNDFEREYLVQILTDYPNASIKEIAERFNWRFKDQEYPKMTAFAWDYVSRGRTLESVRYEYLSAKHKYDTGEIPKKKETADTTPFAKDFAKAMGGNRMNVFGKREKAMDYGSEDEDDDPESKAQSATKKTKRAVADEPKAQSSKKKTMKTKRAAPGDDEPKAQPPKKKAKRATPAQAAQPDEPAEPSSQQYTESDEELLALAGGYDENKVYSPPSSSSSSSSALSSPASPSGPSTPLSRQGSPTGLPVSHSPTLLDRLMSALDHLERESSDDDEMPDASSAASVASSIGLSSGLAGIELDSFNEDGHMSE
jgi:hypothetical protein